MTLRGKNPFDVLNPRTKERALAATSQCRGELRGAGHE